MSSKQIGIGIEYSEKQLKGLLRKNETVIARLQQSIGVKRKQLQQFSNSITRMIEKKIVYKNTSNAEYKHPNFNPYFGDEQLDAKNDLKQSLFKQIQQIKDKIFAIKDSQESAVIHEYDCCYHRAHRKNNIIKGLNRQIKKYQDQRQLLTKQMQENKQMLIYYKNSPCIREIQNTTKELEQAKKQTKTLDREYNQMLAEQILENIYFYGMKTEKDKIQSFQQPEEGDRPVTPKKIKKLMSEVNEIMDSRNAYEKKSQIQIHSLTRNITNLVHENNEIQKRIRSLQGEHMKKELEVRHIREKQKQKEKAKTLRQKQEEKIKTRLNNLKRSVPNRISRGYRSSYQTPENDFKHNYDHQDQKERHNLLLMNENSSQMREEASTKEIVIGEWIEENAARDFESVALNTNKNSRLSSKKIDKVIRLKIKTDIDEHSKIIQVVSEYVDYQGVEYESGGIGRFLSSKLEQSEGQDKKYSKISADEMAHIDLDEVEDFRYMPQQKKQLGIKWIMRDGRVVETGSFSEESSEDIISMDQYYIYTLDFCLDEDLNYIIGIKIILKEYQKQSPIGSGKAPPKKWRSNSEISLLTKKKVFVKPITHLKKNSDLVDHRLLLNRRKKMV